MKIVIDITEERYKDIQRITEVQLNRRTPTVEQIVANGTPLPKNHGRLIDKIRAEIEDLDIFYDNDYFSTNNCPMYKCNEVLLIIDKYKAESEEEE